MAEPPDDDLYGEELGAGAEVGQHVIVAPVAAGGMGTVYRARHAASGAPAAVKVLHRSLATSLVQVRRFEQEAVAVNRLHHPNIVECFDFGQLMDGRPYIVMEWLDGPNLAEVLQREGVLPLERALPVIESLCAALAAAHQAGVVHRDVKPSNVVLATGGVRLVDFGVAKLLDGGHVKLTATGTSIGTPSYMAPEQILGGPTGPTTDVYALGVLIYRTLCGRHPFPARSVSEMEQMHLHRSVTRPGEIAPALSWLDGVVLRCLDKEPGRRYPSVTELLQDLRAAGARPALQTDTVPALALEVRLGDSSAARRRELRGACEAHGLVVAVEDPGFFLAVTVLPDGADAAAARARLEALAEHLATAVDVSVTLHAAPARVLVVDGVTQVVGGELLAVVSG